MDSSGTRGEGFGKSKILKRRINCEKERRVCWSSNHRALSRILPGVHWVAPALRDLHLCIVPWHKHLEHVVWHKCIWGTAAQVSPCLGKHCTATRPHCAALCLLSFPLFLLFVLCVNLQLLLHIFSLLLFPAYNSLPASILSYIFSSTLWCPPPPH